MIQRIIKLQCIGIALLGSYGLFAQEDKLSKKDSIALQEKVRQAKPTGTDRNVMLNADNNSGPREVNIGLPGSVGGITILENDLPVVYFFWPELPNRTWRQSVSLERTGLLKMEQVANTMGDLGFAVNSYSQRGTKDFKLKGKLTGSHYGWFQGDVNVSGPISDKGWSYSAGAFVNFDPSTYDLGFNNYADQTKVFRAGVTKYFNNDKGEFNVFYKYADSYAITNYALFEYGPNGEAKELGDFTIGRDSYVVRDGVMRFKDAVSGAFYNGSLDGDAATTTTHTIDIFGNYKLKNDWNFKYSGRLHLAKASVFTTVPLSILERTAADGFTYQDGTPYEGNVGTQLGMNSPNIPTQTAMARLSLNKKIKNHELTFGILEQYFNVDDYRSNRSFYYTTVENQPQRLLGANTDADGFYNYNVGSEYYDGSENKLSIYANDNWKVNDKFNLSYGLHLRNQRIEGDYYLTPRTPGLVFEEENKTQFENSWYQIAGSINATYNVTKNFGVLANALYTEENGKLNDYSSNVLPRQNKSRSPLAAAGIFWNTKYFQLVSQASYLTKNRYLKRFNLVNPNDATDSQQNTVYYNIETMGWTTDMVIKPFKGFNLHYLITIQDPLYKDFTFEAFGNNYDYSGNNVLEISKVLMEIDPSYSVDKWRFWASFRYFSEQYASLTNALYFAPRWENFGGINYKYNDHISLGATFVNFLNQRGAKGTINGSELIEDASQYYGKVLTGSYIMPFTAQLSLNINF